MSAILVNKMLQMNVIFIFQYDIFFLFSIVPFT